MKHLLFSMLLLLLGQGVFAQAVITGQITDAAGEALPGASIYVEEIKKGAIANRDGIYKMEGLEPGSYTLRFTFVGYKTESRKTRVEPGISKTIMHVMLEDRIISIRPAVVYATRAEKDAPFTFTNLSRTELQEENLGQDVPYMLQRTPSAVVTSDAGTGIGYTGIRIRGTDPTRINVTINGIPLNDAESQGVFWVDLPDIVSSTEDLQIQRGVGTSTNGAAAFGATINLNTTKLNSDPYATVDLSGGSFNTLRGSLRFGSGDLGNGFSLDGRLSRTTSDGYVDRASADLSSWYLSGAWVGEKQWLRLLGFSGSEVTYQSWYGVDASVLEDPETRTYNPAGTEKEGEPYEDQVDDYTQTHLQALYGWNINRNLDFSAALHYTRGLGFYEEYKAAQSISDYGLAKPDTLITSDLVRRRWLDNHFYGGIFSANYISNSNRYRATLGGGWNNYLGGHYGEVIWAQNTGTGVPDQRYYDNEGRKQDFNIYLKQVQKIGQKFDVFLDLQYRMVMYDFQGFDQDGSLIDQTVTHGFFNPKVGLSFSCEDGALVYASFAVANREPNRDDYVDSSPSSRPNPESLYDVEAGYRRSWEKASLEANLYYMYYQDQLVLTGELNDVGAYTRVNVPESYRRGIEISGGIRPLKWLEVGGNIALSQNKIVDYTEYLDDYDADFNYLGQDSIVHGDTDLSFSPGVVAAFDLVLYPLSGLSAKANNLEIGLLNKYVGAQYVDNSSSSGSLLDPYFVSDLRLAWEFAPSRGPESIALTFMVRNLFNEFYSSNGWSYRYFIDGEVDQLRGYYPQAGTHFLAGIKFGF
ncbi:MAG: TonB-dependent receptor [Bacteroidetes bacterium]|nr:TonB-dependent receptor [Bacteroidota bacterium]